MSLRRIKSLAKESLIYGVSGIISKIIVVLLVPVYTRIFLPEDYGMINLINTTFMLAGMLTICALDNSAARWYYDSENDNDRKSIFASWFWFQLLLSFGFAILAMVLSPLVFRYFLKVPLNPQTLWIWLLPSFSLILNILPNMIWNWYRMNRRAISTVVFTLSQSLLTVGLTIVFVVYMQLGVLGVYLALFISGFVFSIIALVQIKHWISWHYFDKILLKEMLRFAIPMIPASLASWLLNSAGSLFLLYYTTKSEVGLFSIGTSIASVVTLFTGSFQQAWGPFAFSIIKEPDADKTYAKVFLVFGVACSAIVCGVFMFAPELLMIFTTEAYYPASWVAGILSLNTVLVAMSFIAVIGSSIAKNNKYYSIGVIAGACFAVLFNLLFIPLWGKEGAAIAMVVSQLLVLAFVFYQAQRLYFIPYKFAVVTFIMALSVCTGVFSRLLTAHDNLQTAMMFKMMVLVVYLFISYIVLRKDLQSITNRLFKGKLNTP